MKTMTPSFKPTLLAVAGLALAAITVPTASAAVIVQFDFEASGAAAATATTVGDGVTASPFTVTGPSGSNVSIPQSVGDNSSDPFASAAGSTFQSVSITQGTGVFSFTLTFNGTDAGDPNEFLNLDTFVFKVSQVNFSPVPTFNVTSSLTGATSLGTGDFGGNLTADGPFALRTVDVSGSEFNLITEGTSVTFNITATAGSDTSGTIRVDKIDIQGSVVPEPTTVAMLLGGFGSLLMLRRRRA